MVADDLSRKFDDVERIPADLDIDRVWRVGTEVERRVLVDEFLGEITVLPDHLEVAVLGTRPVTV